MGNQKARSFWAGIILSVLFALSTPQNVHSQVLYGSLVGNVRDTSDAVVAGDSVTITNSVDHGEIDLRALERLGGVEPAKTSTEYGNAVPGAHK